MKKYMIPIMILVMGVILAISINLTQQNKSEGFTTTQQENPAIKLNVCIWKNDEPKECSHNLLYDTGKNMIRDLLGASGNSSVLNITLCDADLECAEAVADGSEAYNIHNATCGLGSVEGTYGELLTGNFSVQKTFITTCAVTFKINATRLTNVSGTNFAGYNFSLKTLDGSNNDTISINWTLYQ